jgi:hypothetical protein
LRTVPGTASAYAERVQNGYYLEITPDRPALARYGLTVGDLEETIATALGGETVTTTVEGRERYTVNVPLLTRVAKRSPGDRYAGAPAGRHGPRGAARAGRIGAADARAADDPHRERPAGLLHLWSTCMTATSAAMSPTRNARSRRKSASHPATASNGAASSNISNAPRPSSRSSCRSP